MTTLCDREMFYTLTSMCDELTMFTIVCHVLLQIEYVLFVKFKERRIGGTPPPSVKFSKIRVSGICIHSHNDKCAHIVVSS